MSFDKDTRNALAKMVVACRKRLETDVTDQLQSTYGLHPDGTALPIERLSHLSEEQKVAASALRELLDHFTLGAEGNETDRRRSAYNRMVLEISFTILNRLSAIRLCEERGLVLEAVRQGMASDGFRLFEQLSGGVLGTRYETYRIFLEGLFDELAVDLGVLFDKTTPQSVIFPSERCLEEILNLLNNKNLAHLWREDETIGWIYQYFNTDEDRRRARYDDKGKPKAPRNSYELAVRNQFFTPRYVVEFLTDNTLGRIWYEMRKGDTALTEDCRYLVRRPNEVFLGPGEKAPANDDPELDLSQEELLKKPAYIEHRPKKDPRDLKLLDPASGSGHFLLYGFDLLERVYEEAWEDTESPKAEATGRTLREHYGTVDDLRRAIPDLILRWNLHGIDIDPRAVQIAALALWLRAQRSYQSLGLKPIERPRITKSNIVCAEPMPGETDLLKVFTAELKPTVLGQLVEIIFEKMKLAGEAGTLLKIEEEIRDAVTEAKQQWLKGPKPEQLFLSGFGAPHPKQQEFRFDLKGIKDEKFWEQAEDRILAALKQYAERAENGRSVRRRLFADDAAQGFAFIDLCRKRYDVVLMNPPFGEASRSSQSYIKERFPLAKSDVYSCFVKRGTDICDGRLGAITNRIGLFTAYLERWREEVFLHHSKLRLFVDLGYGVLDAALVEAAIYVIECNPSVFGQDAFFFNFLSEESKDLKLSEAIEHTNHAKIEECLSIVSLKEFEHIPAHRMPYWVSKPWRNLFKDYRSFGATWGRVAEGMTTGDNDRYVRLFWEVGPPEIGLSKRWASFAKGGEYAPYYSDLWLLIDWNDGKEGVSAATGAILRNLSSYGIPGLTYSERTTSNLSVRVLPAGAILSTVGLGILLSDEYDRWTALGMWMSHPIQFLVEMCVGSGDTSKSGTAARHYRNGILEAIPFPRLSSDSSGIVANHAKHCFELLRDQDRKNEGSRIFTALSISNFQVSLAENVNMVRKQWLDIAVTVNESADVIERHAVEAFCLKEECIDELDAEMGIPPARFSNGSICLERLRNTFGPGIEQAIDELAKELAGSRWLTKCGYYSDRLLEIVSRVFETEPRIVANTLAVELPESVIRSYDVTVDLISFAIGLIFGRWDVRISLDSSLAPELPDPFDALPVCPPGMLVGPNSLPAKSGCIVSEEWYRARSDANTLPPEVSVKKPTIADDEYPLRISWDGMLGDDLRWNGSQSYRNDIIRRVREVLDLIWKDKAHEIEQEACDILGVSDLRDYFRKPSGFFQDHLKRYSKSRRKAPIYWPLSTASGSYTIWLYYHRLTNQTLYAAVNKYIEPKIADVERDLARIDEDISSASGSVAARLRDRLNEDRTFLGELRDLREELLRVAGLPYKPDLNDGVIINAAPLHNLFLLSSWAKDTKSCWESLQKGEYDWAHMAMNIWPERVREVCRRDRSIAIAHGLESLYEVEVPDSKRKRKKKSDKTKAQRLSKGKAAGVLRTILDGTE